MTINQLTGVTDDLISIKELEKLLKTKNVLTFSFVRHPFERLVSAFQDRILQRNILYEYGYSTWFYNNHSFPSLSYEKREKMSHYTQMSRMEYKNILLTRKRQSSCYSIQTYPKDH